MIEARTCTVDLGSSRSVPLTVTEHGAGRTVLRIDSGYRVLNYCPDLSLYRAIWREAPETRSAMSLGQGFGSS